MQKFFGVSSMGGTPPICWPSGERALCAPGKRSFDRRRWSVWCLCWAVHSLSFSLLLSPSLHTPIPHSQLLNSLSKNPDADCKYGLYFRDGKRKVDYILVYHYKKSSAGKALARRAQHNDASLRSTKQDQPLPGKGVQLEMGESEPHLDYHEDDKRFRREEYEGNLVEAGLELERDEDVRICLGGLKRERETGGQVLGDAELCL